MKLFRKGCAGLLAVLLCLLSAAPLPGRAEGEAPKVVRVGWYESAFHRTDPFGRRSGYGYEYQQRIATYTGWTYEYVEGSWSQLLEMLMAGDLDLLSDVSYTPERAEKILYSAEAMGSEGYHLFITPGNTEICPDDFSTLNGKRVGVNKNSIQEKMFIEWAENHDVTPEIVESSEKTPTLLEMLASGEFDALVTLDTYGNTADVVPVCKVGFAESFFGINPNRPDLKQELDAAMNRLLEDNRDFNQQLTEEYNRSGSVNSFLTQKEKEWLAGRSMIRVGYRDDFMPYCDYDEEQKKLTGALGDFLTFAETCVKNARLTFETMAFATTEDALKALAEGRVDCIFPVCLSSYDGEQRGVVLTDPFVRTEIYAVVSASDRTGISPDRQMTVAVRTAHLNHETFLKDYFPSWQIKYYDSNDASFRAAASGEVDCTLVSNYRISRVAELCTKYRLITLSTGNVMNLSFAVNRRDDCLYSILDKIIRLYPDTIKNSSLTNYGFVEERVNAVEFLRQNWALLVAVAATIAAAILLLILRNVRANARVEEGRQIISQVERDPLTQLYNRNFFHVYAAQLTRTNPSKPMDAVSMNIDRFHSVNAMHGREFGDRVLQGLGREIGAFVKEADGIGCRSEGDRFYLYCPHREDWQEQLERFQSAMDRELGNIRIHLRMGVQPWKAGLDSETQIDRARTACNQVRGGYASLVIAYDQAMEKREEQDQRLLNDLEGALARREFEVYYQPKYRIQTPEPELSSAEALVRWNHPELGMIYPDEFIPLFEQSGRISILDKYVWQEAARQIADWRDRLGVRMPVSVNLSRVDVFDPELAAVLDGLIAEYRLDPADLKLEVTESAYTENASQLVMLIEDLRRKGYEIEMDDFGSGYSSLNMLSEMPVDILKMDIAFIRNIERNEKDFRLVKLIVDIGRYLKVPVVAEGVETEKQLQLLQGAGCDLVQGYYFSRPLPPADYERKILGGQA